MKWYTGNTGNHQGLIIDEETGENIAVAYKKENADLIAAAPELLKACKLAKDFIGNGIKILNDSEPPTSFEEISQMHQVLFLAINYKGE